MTGSANSSGGPNLQASAELDSSKFTQGAEAVSKAARTMVQQVADMDLAFDKFSGGLSKKSQPGLEALRSAMRTTVTDLRSQIDTLTTAYDKLAKELAVSGKAAGSGFSKGLKESGDVALTTAKALRQKLQAEYDQMSNLGKVKLGALENLKGMQISLKPEDSARLKEALELRRLNTDATKQAFATEIKLIKEATEVEKSRSINRRVDAEFAKQVALEAQKASDAASKNVIRNAAFEKKSLEDRIALARTIREVSAVDGVSQDMLRATYGTKAVWASQNLGKLSTKAELAQVVSDSAQTREKQLGIDRVFYAAQESLAVKALQVSAQTAAKTVSEEAVMREKQLGIDRVFYAAQESLARKAAMEAHGAISAAARTQSTQAVNSAQGDYSVYGGANNRDLVKVTKELDTSHKSLNQTLTDAKFAFRGLAGSVGQVYLSYGNLLPLLAGAMVGQGVSSVVKLGADVDNTMRTIQTLSQESAADVGNLNAQLLELARSGPFGPKEVAEAMKTLSLAGLSVVDVAAGIKDVLNFAVAGNTTIKTAADVLTSVGTAFKIGAEGYNYVADVIAKTAAVSKSSVESIGEAFKTASVINSQYGVSLKDVGLGMAVLSNVGIQGTAAGTSLRNAYKDLLHPTEKAAKAMKDLGIEARDSFGNVKPFVELIAQAAAGADRLGKTAGDNALATVFSERGAKGPIEAIALYTQKAREAGTTAENLLIELQQKAADSAGFVIDAAAQMSLTPLNQMRSVKAALEASMVEVFQNISPLVVELSARMKEVFGSNEFKTALQNITVGFGNVAIAIAENIGFIGKLVGAYVSLKTAMSVGALLKVVTTEVIAVTAAMQAAGGVAALFQGSLLGAGAAAATKAGTLLTLSRFLPVVGTAVAAVTTALGLYTLFTSQASAANVTASQETGILDFYAKQRDRLYEANQALALNISLEEYQAGIKQGKDHAGVREASAKGVAAATQAVVVAETELNRVRNSTAIINTAKFLGAEDRAKQAVSNAKYELQAAKNLQEQKEKGIKALSAETQATKDQAMAATRTNAALLEMQARARQSTTLQPPTAVTDAKAHKPTEAEKAVERGEKAYGDIMAKEDGFAKNFTETLLDLVAARDKNNWSTEKYTEVVNAYMAQQPGAVALAKQQEATIKKNDEIRASYDAATESAKEYLDTLRLQADRTADGIGKGTAYRSDQSGLKTIEDKYTASAKSLLKSKDKDGAFLYEERLALARETTAEEVRVYLKGVADKRASELDWTNGAKEASANYLSNIGNVAKSTENMFTKAFQGMEDALVNFVKTGKLDFASLADSILSDLIRIQVQKSIMPGLSAGVEAGASWLASFFSKGGSFNTGGIQAFAGGGTFTNSIVSEPTLFKFASGTGLMGEAGPEAIMPLTRASNGKLGVQASGGGGGNSMVVNIIESPGKGGQQSRRTENGVDILDVFVEKVKTAIASDISRGTGAVPNALAATYSLNRVAGAY